MWHKSFLLITLLAIVQVSQADGQKPIRGYQLNRTHPLTRGLVFYGLMNEGSGSKINDSSGNQNTGTFYGNTNWVPGKFGPCLNFDGVTDYVDLGANPQFDYSSMTVCVWFSFTTDIGSGAGSTLIHGGSSNTNFWEITARLGKIITAIATTGGQMRTANTYNNGQWHHICWIRGSRPYIDGVLTSVDTYNTTYAIEGNAKISRNNATMAWNGLIDNVMIYDRALTAVEISQLYREPFSMFAKPPILAVTEAPPTYRRRIIIAVLTEYVIPIFFGIATFGFCVRRASGPK